MAGASRLLLFLEVAVEHAGRVEADADLGDVVAVLDLCDLPADLLADLRVSADDLDNAAFLDLQLHRDGRAAVVADRSVNDQLAVGGSDDRAQGDFAVGPRHGVARIPRDTALDDRLHRVHIHVEVGTCRRGDVRRLLASPHSLERFAVLVDLLIVCQSAASCEVVDASQADGDLTQLLLVDELLQVVVVDRRAGCGGHSDEDIARVHAQFQGFREDRGFVFAADRHHVDAPLRSEIVCRRCHRLRHSLIGLGVCHDQDFLSRLHCHQIAQNVMGSLHTLDDSVISHRSLPPFV